MVGLYPTSWVVIGVVVRGLFLEVEEQVPHTCLNLPLPFLKHVTLKHRRHVNKSDIGHTRLLATLEEKYMNNYCQSVQKRCRNKEREEKNKARCKALCVNTQA